MGKAALALLLLLSTPAYAVNCYPRLDMMERLAALGQEPWEGGVRDSGHVVIIFVNRETREWTATETRRNREFLCITEKGQGWERKRPMPAERPL